MKTYEATEQAYKNGKADAMKWIPVTERLPEDGDQCLVTVKYKYAYEKEYSIDVDVATYRPEGGYIDYWDTYNDWNEGQQYLHVTHWMPLPEPPEEVRE